MSKLIVLTGASGGIGSSILAGLVKDTSEWKICTLLRKRTIKYNNAFLDSIYADFSTPDISYLTKLEAWINAQNTSEEIILILAAATIRPIEAIGRLDGQLSTNLAINVTSQIYLINTIVRCAEQSGVPVRIIQFDSGAAYKPIGGWALYCASKAYMSMFLKVLAKEHADYKIVLFDPGVVDTGMQRDIREATSDSFVEVETFRTMKENNKLNNPSDVAYFVLSRYIFNWEAEAFNEKFIPLAAHK